ncbi:MAG: 2-vinyl bacteriochlorophyllide hydratase [Deltaproteobacteria bacterium]|nr:MAG: 2-vinyl bacteriochlorophyllide hydratase [Deltaproteobacteria bacterium]
MFTRALETFLNQLDASPWAGASGRVVRTPFRLYTPEQRRLRDASPWTLVQGILAPVQFLVFLVSLVLVVRFLMTGHGEAAATGSVIAKTGMLYLIMVTGSIWEREIFGKYLFAPAFFWEDAISMIVLALHTVYLLALFGGWLDAHGLMLLALLAYGTYVVNAGQFLLKLRAARLDETYWPLRDNSVPSGHFS